MPRYLTHSTKGDLDNTIYEAVELAAAMMVVDNGSLNGIIPNKDLQILVAAGAMAMYSNYIL